MVDKEEVIEAVVGILKEAETRLPDDVISALERSLARESSAIARVQLEAILENVRFAASEGIPMCQDTGILLFFVKLGQDVRLDFDLEDAIAEGVRKATKEIPLRPNAVHPITRENSGDNVGIGIPDVNIEIAPGNELEIVVLPKGAGSENMSQGWMLKPSELGKIDEIILDKLLRAGGMPCPPVILGIGIGGSFDKSAKLAKKALLRDLGEPKDDTEKRILEKVNRLGIGPMGMGGDTTVLAVNVEYSHCHTASLPFAINIQCWADRKARAVLKG